MLLDIPVARITRSQVLDCRGGISLAEAARRMHKEGCSSIIVMENDEPIGIWTERDALDLDFSDPSAIEVPISSVMSSPVKTIHPDVSVRVAGLRFQEDGLRHYLVVDDGGGMIGVLTQTDVIVNQGIENFLVMRDVSEALTMPLLVIAGATPLGEAVEKMREAEVDGVVVDVPGEEGNGIITERDLVRFVASGIGTCSVAEVASRPLIGVSHDTSLLAARDLLFERNIRHLAVISEGGEMLGLLSFSDILRSIEYEYAQRLEKVLEERDKAVARSNQEMKIAHKVIEASLDAVMICDSDGTIEMVNRSFSRVTGYDPEEVIGKNPSILSSGRHDTEFYREMWDTLLEGGLWKGEVWNRRKSGEVFPEWLTITAIRDEEGAVRRYAAIFTDITERKKTEDHIRNLAYFDPLTGLPNRRLFADRLTQAIAHAHRHNSFVAVMFLDLDLFKRVNDSLGHSAGDAVLEETARRLIACMREGDTVARMGGDEFTLILPEVEEVDNVVSLARRIVEEIKRPFAVNGEALNLSTSIGISIYPNDGADVEELLGNADTAMYRAKEMGRDGFQLFSSAMAARSLGRQTLEQNLRDGLDEEQFVLNYQVMADVESGRMIGIEALIRWHHPIAGVIPPADFLEAAERTGLIVPLGEWVLETACATNKAWQDRGLPPVPVAVNVSARQFLDGDLEGAVRRALDASGLDPAYLDIEVTEEAIMPRPEEAMTVLKRLRDIGVGLSIDDFGTGYSNLALLKQMPIDTLKVDGSLIAGIPGDADKVSVVSTIIAMARILEMKVVAEGVETEDQADYLRQHGCDRLQGYLVARPVAAKDVAGLFGFDMLSGDGPKA